MSGDIWQPAGPAEWAAAEGSVWILLHWMISWILHYPWLLSQLGPCNLYLELVKVTKVQYGIQKATSG